jgi:GNAT superfamily N-acetyltransferase
MDNKGTAQFRRNSIALYKAIMKNFKVRCLKPNDMPKMALLLQTREDLDPEGAAKRKILLEWLAFKNPSAGREPTYFIAEHDGRIVAHLGRMPTVFVINGRLEKGYYVHDLYVHPDYRKKGMGFFLTMSLYKTVEESSDSFCCLIWTSALNLEFQRRRGYHELQAHAYVKILNPEYKIRKSLKPKMLIKPTIPILKMFFALLDLFFVRPIPVRAKILKIERFDKAYNDWRQNMIHKFGIQPFKVDSYLNWKLIDRPFSRTEVFAAKENDQFKGFLILSSNNCNGIQEGIIVDLITDPSDEKTISALIRKAVEYFSDQQMNSILCIFTDRRIIRLLRRFFFLKAPKGLPIMLGNLEKFQKKEYLTDISNWHLSLGDSDGMMLEP